MHRTSKYLALALVLIVSAVILVFAVHKSRRHTAGFNVQAATNTRFCYLDSPPIVVLDISSRGGLALNSEAVHKGIHSRKDVGPGIVLLFEPILKRGTCDVFGEQDALDGLRASTIADKYRDTVFGLMQRQHVLRGR